jgi:tRNA nucleotidyltransferase/poly(A) polymerase
VGVVLICRQPERYRGGRVRFIGDPAARIAEDYLRILRFFRIHAAYGSGQPDRAGYLACIGAHAGLATLSAERVRMEMLKLMVASGAAGAVEAMAEGGLLQPIFGGVAYTGPFAAMIAAERLLGLAPDPIRRLGALAVAVTEDAKRVALRMRLSNAETKALDSMGHRWWRLAGMDEATARRRLYRLGEERYRDRLMLAWARAGGRVDAAHWRELATLPKRWSAPKFPLKAADFILAATEPLSGGCWRWPKTRLAADFAGGAIVSVGRAVAAATRATTSLSILAASPASR